MLPLASNFLVPNGTFFAELVLLVLVAAVLVWLVVRAVSHRSPVDELTNLAGLREQGALTDAEFEELKAKLLRG